YRIILSVLAALLAAAFWGLNFTAIYPVLKIIGSEQNLQDWVNSAIKKTQSDQVDKLQIEVDKLTKKAAQAELEPAGRQRDSTAKRLAGELAKLESKLESARHEL